MKILDLELHNIQSHVDTKFTLSPFLNVIKGISNSSDIGKSVVVKGLRLLIENRASKNIRTWNAPTSSSVVVSDGNTIVGRVKDDTLNGYFIKEEGKEDQEFKAIKTDIPHNVQKALNLSEVNIQRQRDTFFLIDESAGQVAKELNKVSGLSTIDATLKRITSEISTITSSIRTQNEIIEKCKSGIEYSRWAVQADTDLWKIENLSEEVDALQDKKTDASSLVESYVHYAKQIKALLPESIVDDYKEIHNIQEGIESLDEKKSIVEGLIQNYSSTHKKLTDISVLDMSEISNIQEEIDVLTTDRKELSLLINSYNRLTVDLKQADEKLAETSVSLSEIKTCPTCKRPWR